jgi:hypothetical protein
MGSAWLIHQALFVFVPGLRVEIGRLQVSFGRELYASGSSGRFSL